MEPVVRCPSCGSLTSEWAAVCGQCGTDVSAQPLLPEPDRASGRPGLLGPGSVRRALVGGALALAVVIGAVVWQASGTGPPSAAGAAPLVPPAVHAGATTVLSFDLLDGRPVQLRYPAQLGIAELGLTLTAMVQWPSAEPGCCTARVSASLVTHADAYGRARPLETYPGSGPHSLGLFSAQGRRLPPGFTGSENLVFRFGGWLVEDDASNTGAGGTPTMTRQDRALWASRLVAALRPGGYVTLTPRAPLTIAPASGSDRLMATFGLGSPNEAQRNVFQVTDGVCGLPTSESSARHDMESDSGPPGVAWCDPVSGLHITAFGSRSFVEGVATGLVITTRPPSVQS